MFQVFLIINAQTPFLLSRSNDLKERTLLSLKEAYLTLEAILQAVSAKLAPEALGLVVCGEDFFQGGNLATEAEVTAGAGECLDREVTLSFFATQLTHLSRLYPNILLIPGSAYLSMRAPESPLLFLQEASRPKLAKLYVQNVMPVFFQGEWLRLIKKGYPLQLKTGTGTLSIESELVFKMLAEKGGKLNVPHYAEDVLDELNPGLVFLGETPMPGEGALLESLGIKDPAFSSLLLNVANKTLGFEICGDHTHKKLDRYLHSKGLPKPDLHIITSDGIGNTYAATHHHGYRIQADASSANLTSLHHAENLRTALPLLTATAQHRPLTFNQSATLVIKPPTKHSPRLFGENNSSNKENIPSAQKNTKVDTPQLASLQSNLR